MNLPCPYPLILLFWKCSSMVFLWTNKSFIFMLQKIDVIICFWFSIGYFLISTWSIWLYCFNFDSSIPFSIISKLTIFVYLKCESVSSKNSFNLFCKHHVLRPSLSYHFRLFGMYFCFIIKLYNETLEKKNTFHYLYSTHLSDN